MSTKPLDVRLLSPALENIAYRPYLCLCARSIILRCHGVSILVGSKPTAHPRVLEPA